MNIYQFLDMYRPKDNQSSAWSLVSLRTGNIRLDYRGRDIHGVRSWWVLHFDGFSEVNQGVVFAE